jgi:ATP-dependent DNA ligase
MRTFAACHFSLVNADFGRSYQASARACLYVDHLKTRGLDLFREACERDLEGIVAKWSQGRYETDGVSTSWLKIKNPTYSQMSGRREVFDLRRDQRQRSRGVSRAPLLRLNPASVTT